MAGDAGATGSGCARPFAPELLALVEVISGEPEIRIGGGKRDR